MIPRPPRSTRTEPLFPYTTLFRSINASAWFTIQGKSTDDRQLEAAFKKGDIKCALIFPAGFGSDLLSKGETSVQIITDGSDPNTAKTIPNYLTSIITDYQQSLAPVAILPYRIRSEEQPSELQSLLRI